MTRSPRPKVTIVTPSFNQAQFLDATIQSVLTQDYPNIEYIVMDGASTDGSVEIIKKYADKLAYWESQKDKGQSDAINKGWRRSTGDIVAFLNSDDTYYSPHVVSEAVLYLTDHPRTGIVFGDSIFIDEYGSEIGQYKAFPFVFDDVVRYCQNPIPQPSAFIRRSVVDKIGLIDTELFYPMDWDYWLRASLYFPIDYVRKTWSTYRIHQDSKTVSAMAKVAPDLLRVYDKLLNHQDFPDRLKRYKTECLARINRVAAEHYFSAGNFRKSATAFWKAWQMDWRVFAVKPLIKWGISLAGRAKE